MEVERNSPDEFQEYDLPDTYVEEPRHCAELKSCLFQYRLAMSSMKRCFNDTKLFSQINRHNFEVNYCTDPGHHNSIWDMELYFAKDSDGKVVLELNLFLKEIVHRAGLMLMKIGIYMTEEESHRTSWFHDKRIELETHHVPLKVGAGCTTFIPIMSEGSIKNESMCLFIDFDMDAPRSTTNTYKNQ